MTAAHDTRPLWVTWRDEDPTVVHLRVFGAGGVLHNPQLPPSEPLSEELPDRQAFSPRPRWDRFRRSQFVADLKDAGLLIGLLLAVVLCMWGGDQMHLLATGGAP